MLKNPAANPDEIETRYVFAEDYQDAQAQAVDIIDNHVFNDVSLVSVDLCEPGDFYDQESAS